jgi:hypothetical protein
VAVARRRHLTATSSKAEGATSIVEAARRDVGGPFPTTRGRSAGPVVEVASDVGRALAELVESLTPDAAGELARFVGDSLASPPSGLLREARLGLLIRLLRARDAELVDTELYEAERERWRLRGVEWPAASTVSRAFGDWLRAQMAAAHLAFLGTGARQPRSHHHTGPRPKYTPSEVLAVMIELRRVYGVWLTSGEYKMVVELRRRAALQLGKPEPRLPSMTPINRLFGGYPAVIAAARAEAGETGAPAGAAIDVADLSPSGLDPVGGARVHPVVGLWWSVVRGRSEADRRFIYLALVRKARGGRSFRSDVMLSALGRCCDELGTCPSIRRYDEWRSAQDDPTEWPPGQTIRSIYHSWRRALIEVGAEPAADILVRRLGGRALPYTTEEVAAAVHQGATDWRVTHPGRPFRFLDYYAWAQAELARDVRRFARLPVSRGTIDRNLGSWANALTVTGHADLLSPAQLGFADQPTDEELLDYLFGAADETGLGARLSPRVYDEWAAATESTLRKGDPTVNIPRYRLIRRRFKLWAVALFRAGVITEAECQRRRYGRGVRMTDQELARVLAAALHELGPTATRAQYRRWREARLTGPYPPPDGLPVDAWLAQRLGSGYWADAKQAALAKHRRTK